MTESEAQKITQKVVFFAQKPPKKPENFDVPHILPHKESTTPWWIFHVFAADFRGGFSRRIRHSKSTFELPHFFPRGRDLLPFFSWGRVYRHILSPHFIATFYRHILSPCFIAMFYRHFLFYFITVQAICQYHFRKY